MCPYAKWKVIANDFRQLKIHQKNYPTNGLELVAIVFGLNILSHFLYGFHVDEFNDHNCL